MTENRIWTTPPPGEAEAEESTWRTGRYTSTQPAGYQADSLLSQVPETSTDLGPDSKAPVSVTGSASTHRVLSPRSRLPPPGESQPSPGSGKTDTQRAGTSPVPEGPSLLPTRSCQDPLGTGHTSTAWPGTGQTPGPHSQPDNSDLVNLFDEFFNQSPGIVSVPGPSVFTLRDTSQKVIRHHHNRLVASLQTANAPPEKISVVPNQFLDPRLFPIIMGINGGTRCLSCGTSAQPTLILEDKKIMDLYQNSQEAKRFTFTCLASGRTIRFESVTFPGWYLSTSPRNNRPIKVTDRLGEAEITNFYFRKV